MILHQLPLSDRVYDRLLTQILGGQRPASQKLSEARLAKEFGVSRVPVREALSRLTRDRLIQSIPRRGKFVKSFSMDEIREAFELRQVLEPMALRSWFADMGRGGLDKVKANMRRLNGIGRIKDIKSRYDLLLKIDGELHFIIRHYSGNKLLEDILQLLDRMAHPLRAFDANDISRMTYLMKERKAILNAIMRKDLAQAESLLTTHIKKGAESILAKLNAVQNKAAASRRDKQS